MKRKTIFLGTEDGIPIIQVQSRGNQFVFWCEHCSCEHYHGKQEGHKLAHCFKPNSPFQKGYILKREKS